MGLILDFQVRRDSKKELRVLEYDSAYPPILGPQVYMVLLTLDERVARWTENVLARKHLIMRTCVLSPTKIPRSSPIDARAMPRRALLEAMLHVRDATNLVLLTNALRALRRFEGNELRIYQAGLQAGRAQALLELLHARGLEVDANSEAKILACLDTKALSAWLARAVTASCVAELVEPS